MNENVSRPHIVKLDLKQCPFCASQDVRAMAVEVALEKLPDWFLPRPGYRHQEYVITCGNCGARGPNEPLVGKAADSWNMRRTEMPAPYVTDKEKP